jgi:hypothetical protein
MRFKIYKNETFDNSRGYFPFLHGYQLGAHMRLAVEALYSGPFSTDPSHVPILEVIFENHTISVGDVVVLIDNGDEYAYNCDMIGWTLLSKEEFRPELGFPGWTTVERARAKGYL